MVSWPKSSPDSRKVPKKQPANFRVRFRHGVFPNPEGEATRAEIKKYDYFFSGEQTWVTTSVNLNFIDESAQVATDLCSTAHGASASIRRQPSRRLTRPQTTIKLPQATPRQGFPTNDTSIQPAFRAATGSSLSSAAPSIASSSPRQTIFQPNWHDSPANSSISSPDGGSSLDWQFDTSSLCIPCHTTHTSSSPGYLNNPIEAQMFRAFVDKFGPRWDTSSSHRIWEKVVPQLALTNPMLMNALLMMGCQGMIQMDPSFPVKPLVYHQKVLQDLIPYLVDHGRIQDEAALVAAILLRGFEERHAGNGGQSHLSTHELFHGPEGFLFDMSSPIVEACFLVQVRFELSHALLNRQSLQIDYQNYILPALVSPSDDVAWSNRVVWMAARILQWTQTESTSSTEWQKLKDAVDTWERERPSSFSTFFYRDADLSVGSYFPEVCFSNICHADAHQYLIICRLGLLLSSPDFGSGGLLMEGVWKEIEVSRWLKEMVAVTRCNPHATSTPITAANAMHRFAVHVRNLQDQSRIMDFLQEVEVVSRWPTELTRQWLRMEWGWSIQGHAAHSNEDIW